MRIAIVAAALAAFAAAASFARAASEGTIDYFNVENVSEAARDLGATNIETAKVETIDVVRLEHSGHRFTFAPQICKDRPGCVGLLMSAGVNTQGQKYPLEVLNSFNRKLPPLTTISFDDGNVAMWRALISEGGVSKANMRANMKLLMDGLPLLLQHLRGQVVASSSGVVAPASAAASPQSIHLLPHHLKEIIADWPASAKNLKP